MAVSNLELDNAIITAGLCDDSSRPEQGRDDFISLPTESRKSLCFSVLPYAFDYLYKRVGSIVMIVSPLIALM